METPPLGSIPSNYPRPDLADDRLVLREIASAQRQIMYCVLAQFVFVGLDLAAGSTKIFALVILVLLLGVAILVFQILSVVRLATSLKEPAWVYIILMFIPCVSLLMLLSLSGKATKRLKAAGIKVGLMGANPNSI